MTDLTLREPLNTDKGPINVIGQNRREKVSADKIFGTNQNFGTFVRQNAFLYEKKQLFGQTLSVGKIFSTDPECSTIWSAEHLYHNVMRYETILKTSIDQ